MIGEACVLKEYVRKLNPDIVIIQEFKIKNADQNIISSIWGFRFKEWVCPFGRSRGIIVMWV